MVSNCVGAQFPSTFDLIKTHIDILKAHKAYIYLPICFNKERKKNSTVAHRERGEDEKQCGYMRKASLVKSVSHPLHPYSLLALILSLSKPTLRYMGFLVHSEMNTRNFTVPKQQGRDESSKQDSKTLKQSEALRRIVSSRGPPKIPPSGGPDITN
ncbi:hypothetical protein MA16_Dca004300 [Dendrobium catenatum]|uniref:Uncharacterized protein n=1 Tax=Dendrobium catenatum TaxID=906689 RepID=A0A2I0W721_9ASPA|nr:hypothetical protein MA16_Dca004300 [Dendrobium catenatum]